MSAAWRSPERGTNDDYLRSEATAALFMTDTIRRESVELMLPVAQLYRRITF